MPKLDVTKHELHNDLVYMIFTRWGDAPGFKEWWKSVESDEKREELYGKMMGAFRFILSQYGVTNMKPPPQPGAPIEVKEIERSN